MDRTLRRDLAQRTGQDGSWLRGDVASSSSAAGGQGGWDTAQCEGHWGLRSPEALMCLMLGLQVRDFPPRGLEWSQH